MNINELTQNDKNMDFKVLNIQKEVQDEVMSFWGFENPGQMFEAGVLLLQTFAAAAQQGCRKAYFEKEVDGKPALYSFDYIGCIHYLKDPNRPVGSTHKIEVKPNEEKP